MMTPKAGVAELARWLQQLKYGDIRAAEVLIPGVIVRDGKRERRLRGVLVGAGLCLCRNRQFYRIIDDHAVVMHLGLVASQYDVTALRQAYAEARRSQPRSRRASA